jgi:hypothetical protein
MAGRPFTRGRGVLVAGIRIEVRPGDVVTVAGTVRGAGTGAAAGKTARAAGYVQGAFAPAQEVLCA